MTGILEAEQVFQHSIMLYILYFMCFIYKGLNFEELYIIYSLNEKHIEPSNKTPSFPNHLSFQHIEIEEGKDEMGNAARDNDEGATSGKQT